MEPPLEGCITGLTGSSTQAGTGCAIYRLSVAVWPTARRWSDNNFLLLAIYFLRKKVTNRVLDTINPDGNKPLHVSLDIDVLDPFEAPATGTAGEKFFFCCSPSPPATDWAEAQVPVLTAYFPVLAWDILRKGELFVTKKIALLG